MKNLIAHFYTWSDDHVCALCEAAARTHECPGCFCVAAAPYKGRPPCDACASIPLLRSARIGFRSKDTESLVLFFEMSLSCH